MGIVHIGLTGLFGSGKSTAIDILKKEYDSIVSVSLSDLIREELISLNMVTTHTSLHTHATSMRCTHGAGYWMSKAGKRYEGADTKIVVYDGLRNSDEVKILKGLPSSYLIGFEADERVRLKRMISRKKLIDQIDTDTLLTTLRDEAVDGGPYGFNIEKCIAMADFIIDANQSREATATQVLEISRIILADR